MTGNTLSPEHVLTDLADAAGLPVDQIDTDADFGDLGVDSIALMGLIERWRADGVSIGFADVAGCRSVGDAVATVASARPADPLPTAPIPTQPTAKDLP